MHTRSPGATRGGFAGRLGRSLQRGMRDAGLAHLPLRWRFRMVVIAFAAPFLGYVVWVATQQAALEKQHVRDEARADATLLAARVEDHIEQVDHLLATAAQAIGVNIDDVRSIDALLQSMRGSMPRSIDNIAVWGLDGHGIASLDRRTVARAVNVADRTYFQEAIRKRDFVFDGPLQSRTTGAYFIQFARPVFDPQNRLIAVLTMGMRPTDLLGMLDRTGIASGATLVTIVNRNGTILARSDEPAAWIGKSASDLDQVESMFVHRNGTAEEVGMDGLQRLAGYAVIGESTWGVRVSEPVEAVLGPTSVRLLRNLAIGLAIFAMAFVVAGRISASTTRPLMQLAADTERLHGGDLSYRSSVDSGGEIATLAGSFNDMAAALEARERELAAGRQQLRAITDNVPAEIYYVDPDERYRFVNAYRGRDHDPVLPADMIGRTIREVRGDAFHATIAPHLRLALDGDGGSFEVARDDRGAVRHAMHTYVPDRDDDGSVRGVYCFAQDITDRKVAELQRMESEKRLAMIANNLPAMICYVDGDRRFRFANRMFEKWFRRPLDEIVGQPFDQLMPPDIAAQYDFYFLRGLRGETTEYEVAIPAAKRGRQWLQCCFIPDVDEATGKPRGVYGMIHNVTKAKEAEQRLRRLAQFDTLTGIANRHQFNEMLGRALARHGDDGAPLALMFLDIDHFKQVNDRYGHAYGDLLLKEFALRLSDSARQKDAVARLSGDEFVVLLEGMHSDEEPQFIARKIIAAVEKPFFLDEQAVRVTTSIGIAMRASADEAASTLMRRADEALYDAKRAGRNTFRLAS